MLEKVPNPVSELELHAYITNVYVLPQARNAGLGALLLETCLAWCKPSGIDAVFLSAEPGEPLALGVRVYPARRPVRAASA